ncbi:ABC-three component system middle component 2 [Sphingorhabdus sp.]|uniref:ABC-three component system middle component 2 n=1 Tax=Sphingorhabdus sp. TaxID=1902408 RepID=UPI0037CAD4E0
MQQGPFNSPLEAGLRSLFVLTAAYPKTFDLGRLVELDYLVVHSGDFDGPPSLHAPVPLRSGEILIRRSLVEKGVLLLVGRGLLERKIQEDGVFFCASEISAPFVMSLTAKYNLDLWKRASWAVEEFGGLGALQIRERFSGLFDAWSTQFQIAQRISD